MPRRTFDSEAIFALAAHSQNAAAALEALQGSMATAWLDEREPDILFAARGIGRPLWLGEGPTGVYFASTSLALDVLEHYCALRLRKREVREGTLVALQAGKAVRSDRFQPQVFVEDDALPPVRAPQEREYCLKRLATIAAAA